MLNSEQHNNVTDNVKLNLVSANKLFFYSFIASAHGNSNTLTWFNYQYLIASLFSQSRMA